MSQPASDHLQQMLFRAATGDECAWRELVDQYSRRVFGLVRSNCGDPDLAEEITQSTFCTVASKLGDYTELGRFESWLFRIAMNRLRDEMRRRKRQALAVDSETLAGLAGATTDTDAAPADEHGIRVLREAVAGLSEADREVILLRHHGGLSFKQIAEVTSEPLGTVLARHHRALRKLAAVIGPLGEHDP